MRPMLMTGLLTVAILADFAVCQLVGTALSVPLIAGSATASVLGPMAVLGALKLIAVGKVMAGFIAESQNYNSGYGYAGDYYRRAGTGNPKQAAYRGERQSRRIPLRHRRYRREALQFVDSNGFNEAEAFAFVAGQDFYGCGKRLVCELEVRSTQEKLTSDESLILSLFGEIRPNTGSAKSQYDNAASLGLYTADLDSCATTFNTCPYNSRQMMQQLREINL